MVILHLVAPAAVGGLERVVHSLAIGQQHAGHDVSVAAVLDASTDAAAFFAPLENAGVRVHRIIAPGRSYGIERRAVRRLIRNRSVQIVHTHGYRPDVIDAGMIRRFGVATVTTVHGYTAGPLVNRLYEVIQRRALRRFDAVVAVSDPLGAFLIRSGVPASRLHVVPNAFMQLAEPFERAEAREKLALPANAFVVGWVGRMVGEKGLDVLVDALPNLADVELTVCAIGSGTEREIQTDRARSHGVENRIRWAGMLPEAGRYFKAFDVYVISSRTEGLPISLFEAMASAVPVVTTRVGGIPQAVTDDDVLLVDPERPARLAAAIREVHHNRAAASARARRAAARLHADFGPDAWLTRYELVYNTAIERRSRVWRPEK
jgi:glycosyltransferase involved in cell wall biosynthesis